MKLLYSLFHNSCNGG